MSENYFYSSLSGQEIEDTLLGSVRGDVAQTRSNLWKAQARQNIGAGAEATGFQILGYYDTLQDLIDSLQVLPQAGDAYGIGAAPPYHIYVYDGTTDSWLDNGTLNVDVVIDDNDTSNVSTWSSQKISTELGSKAEIDDSATAADTTWSSNKISAEITAVTALHITDTITAFPHTISNAAITASMIVLEETVSAAFGTPSAVVSDVGWTIENGSLTLTGTLATGKSSTISINLSETRQSGSSTGTLKNLLAIESITVNWDTTKIKWASWGSSHAKRVGNLLYITATGIAAINNISSSTAIGTIPGISALAAFNFPIYHGTAMNGVGSVTTSNNGDLIINATAMTANTNSYFQIIVPVE